MDYDMGVKLADDGLDKRRRKSAIRRKAIKFTKIVSLVGIRHATDARNSTPRRFIWVAWLFVGFGFAIYQIQECINNYFDYPSVTEFRIIISEEMLLPQITICNENEIVTTKSKDIGFYNYSSVLNASTVKLAKAKEQPNNTVAIQDAETALNRILEEFHVFSKDWENLSKSLALSPDESIIAVTFNGTKDKSLIEEVITDRGHCFAFSTKDRPLYVTRAGSSSGLFLVLSVARKDYEHNAAFEPGYRMLIHDAEEIPRMKEGGFPLKPGVITRVAVSLQDVQQLGPPYGNCSADKPDYKEENCMAEWDYRLFLKQCGCITMDAKLVSQDNNTLAAEVCSYANIFNCTIVNKDAFLNTTIDEPNCPRQCHSRLYTSTNFESNFPMLMNEASTNVQGDSQMLDRIRVYVYYPDMTYTEAHNKEEYLFLDLLCDIGGALSLLLGATLLTVYEAGEFLLLFARDYLHLRLVK